MTIDRASNRVAPEPIGRGILFLTLWMLACVGVAVAVDVILGPSSRRYMRGLAQGAVGIGGFIILKLTWTPTASRAKETPKDDPPA
jgi:hypothetical protein